MKRFIRYLYEYKQGKRIRNVGFVKVEAGNEETIVHMQGKGFHMSKERKLVLYLFFEENGKLFGIRQLEMELVAPVMNCHLRYTAEEVGALQNYSKIRGIILVADSGRRFAVTWDDRLVDVSRMEEYAERDASGDMPAGQSAGQSTECQEELDREEEKSGPKVRENQELVHAEMSAGREGENAGRIAPGNESDTLEDDSVNQRSLSNMPQPGRKFTKIQRNDLAKLPRCEWKLANNHFLMHGYNNYRHLMLIEEGNIWKLGVPGIYHINEAKAADTFGFGEFLPIEETKVSLEPEEMHQDEPFGYWCRPVKKMRRIS